jgi:hypothetical protein
MSYWVQSSSLSLKLLYRGQGTEKGRTRVVQFRGQVEVGMRGDWVPRQTLSTSAGPWLPECSHPSAFPLQGQFSYLESEGMESSDLWPEKAITLLPLICFLSLLPEPLHPPSPVTSLWRGSVFLSVRQKSQCIRDGLCLSAFICNMA